MKCCMPKFLLALGAPLMFTACATIGPPQPPSLELPRPPSDLRAMRKGEHVTLTWTAPSITTDRQKIRSKDPTRVCRGIGEGRVLRKQAPPRLTLANRKLQYRILTLSLRNCKATILPRSRLTLSKC